MVMSEKYPFLSLKRMELYEKYDRAKYKTERGFRNFLQRENDKIKKEVWFPEVEELAINIDWKKNSCGEMQAHATASWRTKDGSYHQIRNPVRSKGWGFDKESHVIVECLNKILFGFMMRKIISGIVI